MQKVLLASATAFEIQPALLFLESCKNTDTGHFSLGSLTIELCITKVGMVNTAFELGKLAHRHYDLAINAGVAGSFGKYAPGHVVNVNADCFSELGAEDGPGFLSIDEMGFGAQHVVPEQPFRNPVTDKLPVASGITVNTVHGNEASIEKITRIQQADIETMEGAAFIHAANAAGWTAIQLRAISNKVERRDKNNWQMPLAIKNLNNVLIELIKDLSN